MAVTLNRFGEIVELDSGSKAGLKPALERVNEQRKPYKEEKEPSGKKKDKASAGLEGSDYYTMLMGGTTKDGKAKKKKGKRRVNNPLKAQSAMSSAMMGMGMGSGFSPDASGTGSKKKKTGGSGSIGGVDRSN